MESCSLFAVINLGDSLGDSAFFAFVINLGDSGFGDSPKFLK